MKNSRKKIIQDIELLDTKLQYHQLNATMHQNALMRCLRENKVSIIACIIPLLYFIPWKKLPLRNLALTSGLALKQVLRLGIAHMVRK